MTPLAWLTVGVTLAAIAVCVIPPLIMLWRIRVQERASRRAFRRRARRGWPTK